MRTLLILRGNYHAGQDEFIRENNLRSFTLDINELRFFSTRTSQLANSFKSLDYKHDEELFKILLHFLELRMKKGEFCVLNTYENSYRVYKDLALKYRYKTFIIDFSDISLKECQKNNIAKAKKYGILTPYKFLEERAELLQKAPKSYEKNEILKPDEWQKSLYQIKDLNSYKKIHHIGDIQGCYSVLKSYIQEIKDDEYYIFLGDYIDRGIENAKVLKYLIKICQKPNVYLLEGNHERHLIHWARGESVSSKEFNENTLKDFQKEKFTRKHAADFYPYLKECLLYEYDKKKIFCSHGGVNFLPKKAQDLSFIPSSDFVFGIGDYEQSEEIAMQFCQNTPKNYFQLFGHRNRFKLPIRLASRVFLCEGKVDDGGYLRVVTLDKKGFECIELKNEVYRKK